MIRKRNKGIEREKKKKESKGKKSKRERKKNFDPEAEPYPSCTPESPGGDRFNDVKLFSWVLSTSFFTPHIKKKEICFGTTSHQGSSSSEGSQF